MSSRNQPLTAAHRAAISAALKGNPATGRPRKLTDPARRDLRLLYDARQTDIATICRTFNISRATLYRELARLA
jgi:transcriptional regulator of acetoin/glycerol metabolism